MATIEEYVSGKICEHIKTAFTLFDSTDKNLKATDLGKGLSREVEKFDPVKLTVDEAVNLAEESEFCAIGDRVCLAVFKDAPLTETVFLGDLGKELVKVKKARPATKEEAIENIHKYRKYPIIISKVSGEHSEMCFTWPKYCVYWNTEKRGLKCIKK